jgi:hypothetical protein
MREEEDHMIDPNAKNWSIMLQAKNGTFSYIRELTLKEAKNLYIVNLPDYKRTWVEYEPVDGHSFYCFWDGPSDDHCLRVEVFGPEGWNHEEVRYWGSEWPKHVTIPVDDASHPIHGIRRRERKHATESPLPPLLPVSIIEPPNTNNSYAPLLPAIIMVLFMAIVYAILQYSVK